MHIVFVANATSKNVNEKIKTQTSGRPFVGGCMLAALIDLVAKRSFSHDRGTSHEFLSNWHLNSDGK